MKSNNTLDYQNTLRAIGQGIEKLGVESFDLETADNQVFIVSGIYREAKEAGAPNGGPKKSILTRIFNAAKDNYRQITGPRVFRFSGIRFTQSDIELLDRAGKASRSSWGGRPMKSPTSISYVLRAAGSFLDRRGSRFLRLSWRHDTLTVWHIEETGAEAQEIFSLQKLYRDLAR
jgi:hypothetical protein